jgi:multiple sugar transport system substrate-binding protein
VIKKFIAPILIALLTGVVLVYLLVIRIDRPVPVVQTKVDLTGTSFEQLDLPENYDLRQYEGVTLRFIVENNRHATILLNKSQEFHELTGINVKIIAVDFDTLVQKINLDFISKSGEYQVVYVDPYQTLNRFYDCFEVLNDYNTDPNKPHVIGFPSDFSDFQVQSISCFENANTYYTIPFDSTTMIMFYRKDIFERYENRFFREKGYDWTPGKSTFTWEKYIEVANWIDQNVPDRDVKYGCSAMAQEHNSIFCEFSNVLASYGGDYFSDENVGTLGIKSFRGIRVLDDSFIKALDIYKQVVNVAAPESIDWNWTDAAEAFQKGEVAMMLNWDENYPFLNDPEYSKVADNVGCAILPYGSARSANIFGGSGIGINKYATPEEKEAAWLFIVWATSEQMQREILINPEGGNLPSRSSVYQETDIMQALENPEKSDWMLDYDLVKTVLQAWEPENLYLRPKVSSSYFIEQVLNKHLHDFISNDRDSTEVSRQIYEDLLAIRQQYGEAP